MFHKDYIRYIIAGIIILLFWLLVGFVAYKRLSTHPTVSSYCNDYGCTNFRDGSNWAIRNCQGSTTEGSTYTCTQQGITGSCGTTSYCCPGPGMLWTTDMTQCSGSAETSGCCACPAPTPYTITSQCNGPCMGNSNCTDGNICIFEQGFGWVCRNPACYRNTGCNCASVTATPTLTPTPTSIQGQYYCGELCLTTSECRSDLRCVSINNTRECRNPDCPEENTCLCIE
ncbi:MAG: hypothetical protein UW52_C0032G0009 [Candidatus Gottesmanbacteria bacterium GW2011_GWA1_44_24b]|nr:MAG: hypothetical protein UW52_C0032G0009 [Candidatus Gottesmanbacteria bacterium GW2011_GWA1_44_24b]